MTLPAFPQPPLLVTRRTARRLALADRDYAERKRAAQEARARMADTIFFLSEPKETEVAQ